MPEPQLPAEPTAPAAAPSGSQRSGGSRRKIAPIIALVVAAVLGGLFWVLATSKSGVEDQLGVVASPLLDKPAPAVRGTLIGDQPFDLARRKGSWVVLNFFNTDCVGCVAEHSELVKFTEQQAAFADGAELYSIDQLPDTDAKVAVFFAERGGNWAVVRDDVGAFMVAFGVAQLPETFIIDPDGIVRLRWAGPITADVLSNLVQQERDIYAAGGAG